ncbi:MAG: sulfatase [Phycisphaerales bacterium]|nr:sulfatase [Phycisphaerales bacterium]
MIEWTFTLILCFAESRSAADTPTARQPNIVFVMTDDHASAAVSAYGSHLNQTPHIDALADQGTLFENAFCTNGICAPSRAVFLTGTHSHINGVEDNGDIFDGSQATFPSLLQDAGYQTALFGKWHLKTDPTGFDHWEVLPGQGHYYAPEFVTADGKHNVSGYCTDITTDKAIDWLAGREDKDRPFLLMVQHKAPHRSWMPGPDHLNLYEDVKIAEPATLFDDYATRSDAARNQEMSIANHMWMNYDLKVPPIDKEGVLDGPDRWADGLLERMTTSERSNWNAAFEPRNQSFREEGLEGQDLVRWKYQRYIKNYLRCIASVDDNVGRLNEALEAAGLSGNTIFIYVSDQGFYLGEHGWYDKRFMYEPSLRLPMIIRWPGQAIAGQRRQELVQNLDMAQTLLDAAGVAAPDRMQGQSMLPLIRGDSVDPWRSSIYYEYSEQGIHNVEPHYGVRTSRYKLIYFPGLDAWELYDLKVDPNEIDNRIDDQKYADIAANLRSELTRLRHHYQVEESKGQDQ